MIGCPVPLVTAASRKSILPTGKSGVSDFGKKSLQNNFRRVLVFDETGAQKPRPTYRTSTRRDCRACPRGCERSAERASGEIRSSDRSAPRRACQGMGTPFSLFHSLLFRDRAAGDPVSGIARRVRLQIIGLRVNYQRGAAIAEHRMIVAAQINVLVRHVGLGRSI